MSDLREKPTLWKELWQDVQNLGSSYDVTIQSPHHDDRKRKRRPTLRELPNMYYTSTTGHREEIEMADVTDTTVVYTPQIHYRHDRRVHDGRVCYGHDRRACILRTRRSCL